MKALAACLLFSGAAQAAVIGVVPTEGGTLEIQDSVGMCVGNARAITYVPKSGKPIQGCWLINGENIQAAFLDGDVLMFPVRIIKQPTRL